MTACRNPEVTDLPPSALAEATPGLSDDMRSDCRQEGCNIQAVVQLQLIQGMLLEKPFMGVKRIHVVLPKAVTARVFQQFLELFLSPAAGLASLQEVGNTLTVGNIEPNQRCHTRKHLPEDRTVDALHDPRAAVRSLGHQSVTFVARTLSDKIRHPMKVVEMKRRVL